MTSWIMFAIGILIGCLVSFIFRKSRYTGTLLLYREFPDEPPGLSLELNDEADKLYGKSYVIFKIRSLK